MATDVLPDARARDPKSTFQHRGLTWVQLNCISCGTDKGGGWVPVRENCQFACYICDVCFPKYGHLTGTMVEPDQAFWERVRDAQREELGDVLIGDELVKAIQDDDTVAGRLMAKLAKDRPK